LVIVQHKLLTLPEHLYASPFGVARFLVVLFYWSLCVCLSFIFCWSLYIMSCYLWPLIRCPLSSAGHCISCPAIYDLSYVVLYILLVIVYHVLLFMASHTLSCIFCWALYIMSCYLWPLIRFIFSYVTAYFPLRFTLVYSKQYLLRFDQIVFCIVVIGYIVDY
jgi:hypothetical protein